MRQASTAPGSKSGACRTSTNCSAIRFTQLRGHGTVDCADHPERGQRVGRQRPLVRSLDRRRHRELPGVRVLDDHARRQRELAEQKQCAGKVVEVDERQRPAVELLDLREEVAPRAKLPVVGRALVRVLSVREIENQDLEWLIHRQMYLKQIDVLQLEYTPMAQYRCDFRRIPRALFEHDIYFQSIARGLGRHPGVMDEFKARMEYLRALRFELGALPDCDQVQV